MQEVSEAARKLKELRERAGLSMRVVADGLGWTLTRYQHYEDRYKRRHLPVDLMRDLVRIFHGRGVEQTELLELAGIDVPGGQRPVKEMPKLSPEPGSYIAAGRDLPVVGAVKGGADGFYFNEGDAKEFVIRPPSLAGVANGFALYVDGESMEPRYFAGEILYVNPNRPITRACFVAVEMQDGRGMIKQFLRRSDDLIQLRQFNPPKDIRLPAREVKRIYRITGSGEAS